MARNLAGKHFAHWKGAYPYSVLNLCLTGQQRPDLYPCIQRCKRTRSHEATSATSLKLAHEIQNQLDFTDHENAFISKRTLQLIRALIVYKICSYDALVKRNKQLIKLSRKVFGRKGFELLMKGTFYGHFVAGEDQDDIKDKLELMRKYGVGSILDYAVEADMPKGEGSISDRSSSHAEDEDYEVTDLADIYNRYRLHRKFDRQDQLYSARTYYYEGEKKCDENMEVFLKCIDTTGNTAEDGFAAIKVTALGRPAILLRLSQILNQTQYYFDQMAVKSSNALKFKIALQNFKDGLVNLGVNMSEEEAERVFQIIDVNKDGSIDAIEWHNFLTPQLQLAKLFRAKPKIMGELGEPIIASLSTTELKEIENMTERLIIIAKRAQEKGVRLMVDAEQTYFQPAISRITLEAMRLFNRDRVVVMNTYQCYLKQTYGQVAVDMELARREGFHFGAKLVRGAYMEQEAKRAEELGYDNPVLPNYEATNESYNETLAMVLEEVKHGNANVMVASHNEDSVKFTVERMKEMSMNPREGKVFFGQLLGMCDAVTFALGQAGYAAYKYVPYGPVDEVMPYLSRRAMENRSLMKGVVKEREMLWNELRRRIRERQLFHDPSAVTTVSTSSS